MKKVAITADSTCDLSEDLLEKYQVEIIPLHVRLGEEEYFDGVDITPERIYAWSDENRATPKTSAVAPMEAKAFLDRQLARSEQVICFCISGDMSTTANVLRMEAEASGQKERVFIIDSESLSTGIGLQVIEAALMAQKGMDAASIVEEIEKIKPLVRASFVVDTLTYLHRGGRCSGLAAFAGSTLRLHPCILVENGKMRPGKKYRGRMEKVVEEYVQDLKEELGKARRERVFITHSGSSAEIVEAVRKQLEELQYFGEVLVTNAGSVIASHCGPGTLGVLFISK